MAAAAGGKKRVGPTVPLPNAASNHQVSPPVASSVGVGQSHISPVAEEHDEMKVGSLESQSVVSITGSISRKTAGKSTGRRKFGGGLRESLRNVFGKNDDNESGVETTSVEQSRRASVDGNDGNAAADEGDDDLMRSPSTEVEADNGSSDDLSVLAWDKRNNVYSSIVNEMASKLQQRRNAADVGGTGPSPSAGAILQSAPRFKDEPVPAPLESPSDSKEMNFVDESCEKDKGKRKPVFVPYVAPGELSSNDAPVEEKPTAPSAEKLSKDGVERLQSALEIWSTEETYVAQLESLTTDLIRWLKAYGNAGVKPLMREQDIQMIFGSISELATLHRKMLNKLRELKEVGNEHLERNVGDVFIKFSPYFKIYFNHVHSFSSNQEKLKVERKKNADLDRFLTVFEFLAKQTVESLLITPVQRIPRYKLLFDRIKKHCRYLNSEEDALYVKMVETALTKVEEIAAQIESMMEMSEAREKVVQIQEKVFKNRVALVSPRRYCIRIAVLAKLHESKSGSSSHKKYLFILFNDLLIYSTVPDKARSAQLRAEIPLEDVALENMPDEDNLANAFRIVGPKRSITLFANNPKEKDDWLGDIRSCVRQLNAVAESKRKLESQGSLANLSLAETVSAI
eukprot:TRINITY_DN6411_c0_g2_i1.p1 TRINITY_DN6411_c0_g2~~TRINITY_DN6411_c0_g2_i1.p1  ORF type:complete len:660 (+),score=172.52 TRINITY_DN6411_c0_g2_i1:102-1982(+)